MGPVSRTRSERNHGRGTFSPAQAPVQRRGGAVALVKALPPFRPPAGGSRAPGSRLVQAQARALCTGGVNVGSWGQSGRAGGMTGESGFSHKQTLAFRKEVEHWSLTTLRERLVKIGASVVSQAGYCTCQPAEVAVPRDLCRKPGA